MTTSLTVVDDTRDLAESLHSTPHECYVTAYRALKNSGCSHEHAQFVAKQARDVAIARYHTTDRTIPREQRLCPRCNDDYKVPGQGYCKACAKQYDQNRREMLAKREAKKVKAT